MSKSLQDCNTHVPYKQRKQAAPVTAVAPENGPELVKLDTIVNNLEILDVKTKIKLMESFVSTNPIPISKSNERSASASSTGSTSSSESSSSSKSPPISPK